MRLQSKNQEIDDVNGRLDYEFISGVVEQGATVLDMGCGNGDLLDLLKLNKGTVGQGIERNEQAVYRCVERGIRVFHLDFDTGLASFPEQSFDYVVLNQSLQETVHVEYVLSEALRVGRKVIVGFPNFAYIGARFQLFWRGLTPVTNALPHYWYNTPNLHFLSIKDFRNYVAEHEMKITSEYFFSGKRRVRIRPNLLAMNGLFVIQKKE